jgi:hypothetical protein
MSGRFRREDRMPGKCETFEREAAIPGEWVAEEEAPAP